MTARTGLRPASGPGCTKCSLAEPRTASLLDMDDAAIDASQSERCRRARTGPSPVQRRPGSKHHLMIERHVTPLADTLTGGNDVTQLALLLDAFSASAEFAGVAGSTGPANSRLRLRLRLRQVPGHSPGWRVGALCTSSPAASPLSRKKIPSSLKLRASSRRLAWRHLRRRRIRPNDSLRSGHRGRPGLTIPGDEYEVPPAAMSRGLSHGTLLGQV